MPVTLGVPGRIMPPARKAVELAQKAEADGFDAIWWPCHLMGWIPDSAWTDDMTGLAAHQPNPHVHFEPLTMMGAAGSATERIRVGVNVTDTIRRHPAMLAQQALTVDHLSEGRAVIGLGSGERMNVTPYGIEWRKPVSRLEEAIQVMKRLWGADGPVSFDGDFFQLTDAVLGLDPYQDRDPEIWLGAHGPRMLDICGRLAEGWLPTNVTPETYGEKLSVIRGSAEGADRDPDAITASMLAYVLCAPDEETLERLANQPMTRLLFAAVDLSPETYARHGSTSPFEGGTGFHSFVPTRVPRPEVERVISHIPAGIVKEGTLHGTPEQIVDQIAEYQREGLDDVILWNITPFADPDLAGYSFKAMKAVKALVDAGA